MGLTLHYTLATEKTGVTAARRLVAGLHEHAQTLGFLDVGQIREWEAGDDTVEPPREEMSRWLWIQSHLQIQLGDDGDSWATVPPKRLIAFTIHPGEGSEAANIGLCQYPATFEYEGQRRRTGTKGWRWSSFCKTQYASNPACGGTENFLRCHVGLIELLDAAKGMGLSVNVTDESGYAEHRDVERLVETVNRWNNVVAGFVGQFRDAVEGAGGDHRGLVSEITRFPNFEHLEAEGRRGPDDPPDDEDGDCTG